MKIKTDPLFYEKIIKITSLETMLVSTIFLSRAFLFLMNMISKGNLNQIMQDNPTTAKVFSLAPIVLILSLMTDLRKKIDKNIQNTTKKENEEAIKKAIKTKNLYIVGLALIAQLATVIAFIISKENTLLLALLLMVQLFITIISIMILAKGRNKSIQQ